MFLLFSYTNPMLHYVGTICLQSCNSAIPPYCQVSFSPYYHYILLTSKLLCLFRQKTLGHRTHCSECNMVQGQFCGDCLYMRYILASSAANSLLVYVLTFVTTILMLSCHVHVISAYGFVMAHVVLLMEVGRYFISSIYIITLNTVPY